MDLNVLLRGQSNAFLTGLFHGNDIVARAQQLLGFDGVTDKVTLEYAHDQPDAAGNTVYSGTSFLNEWLNPTSTGGWQVGQLEQGLLNYINALPAAQKAEPTAVVWLHSEYDSGFGTLTPAYWESAVQYDAALVRQAFGKDAASLPYLFVSAIPYGSGTDAGHQAIRIGMEELADNPAFNASIAARIQDANMDWDINGTYGGSHMSWQDQDILATRIALSIAQDFAAYAKPGSAVALAGGQVDNLGPEVISATVSAPNQLMLKVAFDAASSLAALDASAAQGVGWSLIGADGTKISGGAAALAIGGPDTLYVSFNGLIPAGAKLYYGYGYGRLAGADGTGEGHAVYDNAGLPIWVDAHGLAVGGAAVAGPDTATGNAVQVGAAGGSFTGTAAAETWVFSQGSGATTIANFDPTQDNLSFSGIPGDHLIYWDTAPLGFAGLGVTWTGAQGGVILPGVSAVPDSHVLIA
ncbi:hypothetical protein [Paracraurococcus lichenis]|uniref:Uncharacterized protein n=1 Tax=Paracraurococcus lichenis TaxID=3064888 RepID=A0ABT9DSU5_9PROT|nr:hypothetical protein [Paracraurococcus sp. LOR1-02]MDO9706970.1 hypothetical protein [Paracraurococcus sp. LOR1-02]